LGLSNEKEENNRSHSRPEARRSQDQGQLESSGQEVPAKEETGRGLAEVKKGIGTA